MGIIADFFVPGIAQPGGSKRAFIPKGWNRAVIVDANPQSKSWKAVVGWHAKNEMKGNPPVACPVKVELYFWRPYRKGDLRKDGTIKGTPWPTSKPDVLKLSRTVEDALTGIVWVDDAQITDEVIQKRYATRPGVRIVVESLE